MCVPSRDEMMTLASVDCAQPRVSCAENRAFDPTATNKWVCLPSESYGRNDPEEDCD